MLRSAIDAREGVLNLHFGWICQLCQLCQRVAEELGDQIPEALARVSYSENENGQQVLTLKPSVVAALTPSKPMSK
jgi:hypothetical protein